MTTYTNEWRTKGLPSVLFKRIQRLPTTNRLVFKLFYREYKGFSWSGSYLCVQVQVHLPHCLCSLGLFFSPRTFQVFPFLFSHAIPCTSKGLSTPTPLFIVYQVSNQSLIKFQFHEVSPDMWGSSTHSPLTIYWSFCNSNYNSPIAYLHVYILLNYSVENRNMPLHCSLQTCIPEVTF